MNQHLTDEQFAELLAGQYRREYASHLNTCRTCKDELEQSRTAILDFSTLSLRAAQQRSATMARPLTRGERGLLAPPAIWTTAAASLVFGAAFGVHHFRAAARPPASFTTTAHVHPAQDQQAITEDNALMSAIDADLRWKPDAAVDTPAALVLGAHTSASSKLVSE